MRDDRSLGRSIKLWLLGVLGLLAIVFAVKNRQSVEVSLVFGEMTMPLVWTLLLTFALGGAIGWLAGRLGNRRRELERERRRRPPEEDREKQDGEHGNR